MLSAEFLVSRVPRVEYGDFVYTVSVRESSKNSCEVKSVLTAPALSNVRTRTWMWTVRPEYQPGYTVVNETTPLASETW
jgi:hypothetical protein